MSYETHQELDKKLMQLYKEGALDVRVSLKIKATNEIMMKITGILCKSKIEHFQVVKTIQHPIKDIEPSKHEEHVTVSMVAIAATLHHVIEELGKIAETDIGRLQGGLRLFKDWGGGAIYVLKEEEPQ